MVSQPPHHEGVAPLMGSLLSTYTMPCITSGALKAWSKSHWFHPNVLNYGRNGYIHKFFLCFTLNFVHALPSSQPRNYKLLPVTLIFCPQNECDPSSLSPQKKFWYFHFFYKQNQHIIYVCEQSDFMVFLFVDRMIGIKLHSVDKKCDEMSFVNIMNKRVWQNAVCQWDIVKVLTKWILSAICPRNDMWIFRNPPCQNKK